MSKQSSWLEIRLLRSAPACNLTRQSRRYFFSEFYRSLRDSSRVEGEEQRTSLTISPVVGPSLLLPVRPLCELRQLALKSVGRATCARVHQLYQWAVTVQNHEGEMEKRGKTCTIPSPLIPWSVFYTPTSEETELLRECYRGTPFSGGSPEAQFLVWWGIQTMMALLNEKKSEIAKDPSFLRPVLTYWLQEEFLPLLHFFTVPSAASLRNTTAVQEDKKLFSSSRSSSFLIGLTSSTACLVLHYTCFIGMLGLVEANPLSFSMPLFNPLNDISSDFKEVGECLLAQLSLLAHDDSQLHEPTTQLGGQPTSRDRRSSLLWAVRLQCSLEEAITAHCGQQLGEEINVSGEGYSLSSTIKEYFNNPQELFQKRRCPRFSNTLLHPFPSKELQRLDEQQIHQMHKQLSFIGRTSFNPSS